MKTKNLAFLGLLGTAGISSMAFAPSAEAVVVTYSLTPGNFTQLTNPAGSLSGSFDFDTVGGTFANINIVTTAATNFASRTYTQLLFGNANTAIFNTGTSGEDLSMSFGPPLTSAYLSNPSSFGATESQGGFSRSANDIQAIGTPVPFESDAFPVVASGVLLGAGFWLKRKRDMAKVQLPVSLPQPPEMVASAAE
ncbi:hypothetical protein NON20_16735 [Synechocystis sp. B12]|nr:hypothetical protein NON20_16735 [Synechocystis sp. B12]